MIDKWDLRYLSLALEFSTWSKDSSRTGAVCVSPDKRSIVPGYNGFPKGIEDDPAKLMDKKLKNELMVHAEANCIVNANVLLHGWSMHVTKAPCTNCSLLMINAGIARIVCPNPGGSWESNQLVAIGLLTQAGIQVEFYDG